LNKRYIYYITIFFWGFLFLLKFSAFGQLSVGGVPPSTVFNLQDQRNVSELVRPDLQRIHSEDEDFPMPYRYGINLPADFSPETSGSWVNLADGGRLWRLTIRVDGALALSACFDRVHLPAGGKLFLYNLHKSQVIGAFTSKNNTPQEYFATELLGGDQFTLEYYQPAGSSGDLRLHLNEIVYAYRGVGFLGNSPDITGNAGSCEVNVNCPEGQNWQLQKKGVVRISIKKDSSSYWCSGSLLNNVRQNHTPYILTADHCGLNVTPNELLQWVFYFNHESSGCQNPGVPPTPKSLTGAIKVAESGNSALQGSDFYLVVLTGPIPSSYNVYFNGWNRQNIPSHSGVGIHHPEGDIKKISTYSKLLETSTYGTNVDFSFWKVVWDQTISGHGVTEPGSSGSPIFDTNGRVVGTLTGGWSACDSASLNLADYYGKVYWSWDLNGNDSTRRLRDWLDPDSTGVKFLDGLYLSLPEKESKKSFRLFPNPFNDYITIEMPGTSSSVFRIEVYDFIGNLIEKNEIRLKDSSSANIHFPGLTPGMYLLKVFSGDEVFCVKMIKQ